MSALDSTLRKAEALTRAGSRAAAAELYLDVLDRFPANRRARNGLAAAVKAANAQEAARLQAEMASVGGFLSQGAFPQALAMLQGLVARYGHVPGVQALAGAALYGAGRVEEALTAFQLAARLDPGSPEFAAQAAAMLVELGRADEALALVSGSTALSLRQAEARALAALGRSGDAVACFDAVLAQAPGTAEVLAERGAARFAGGDAAGALEDVGRARGLAPTRAEFLRMHTTMTRVTGDDPVTGEIEAALSAAPALPDQVRLLFGLGKARHDLGETDAAFAAWAEANRLYKSLRGYDLTRDALIMAEVKSAFSQPPAPLDVAPLHDRRPIFVVGLPRSGTSLIEQILASHAEVHGAGELPDLALAVTQGGSPATLPDPERLAAIRTRYLAGLARKTPGAPWVVDKMPLNFRLVGHIAAALPEARILHLRRDPVATCWSNFRHFFPGGGTGTDFSYDLGDLGRYWRLYDDLMRFWQRTLPGRVIEVDYDALVADPSAQIPALLSAAGLSQDEACLHPEANNRPVLTASAAQVRQPIYRGSSDAWQRYEAHLGPLLAALGRDASR